MDTLDLLLKTEIPNAPEKSVKLRRLSRECGGDVVFRLRALPYSRVAEIEEMHKGGDMPVFILLAGCVSPDLKNRDLMEKYKTVTPEDLIKSMLLPGEIEELSREVERLSGYRTLTFDEIKKK